MTDDLSVFWQNNDTAAVLFYELLTRAQHGAYDDDFLARLAAYRTAGGDAVHADIFAARYLLHEGDAENAIVCGERAYARRPVNLAVWKVLAAAYKEVGRDLDALTMQGHIRGTYPNEPIHLRFPQNDLDAALTRFSLAANNSCYAPLVTERAYIENDELRSRFDIFLGETIPLVHGGDTPLWAGVYVDEGFLSTMSTVYENARHDMNFMINNRDIAFDLQKAHTVTGTHRVDLPDGIPCPLPVAGTKFAQGFAIGDAAGEHIGHLGKYAFSYFRCDESITLRSEEGVPYAVGTPIPLRHSPARKKLVLNLLIDGLCWPAVRAHFAEWMPRIARFFAHGTIFDAHYSASDHTLPSFPSIETGLYSHHTHIFIERDSHELPPTIKTVSERMKVLGYYCTAPLLSGHGIYHGTLRGYDRLVANYGFMIAYEGVERALRALEAFPETDHFMLLHTTDVHPLNIQTPPKFSTAVEVNTPLAERFVPLDPTLPSVRIPHLPIHLAQFCTSLRHVDRTVGQLLDYIEEHYSKDEYIVNLYSDHGHGLFDPDAATPDLIGHYATGATWMMRGAGVPEGVVTNELTSAVDIYPTLAHLCGFPVDTKIDGSLPAIFGGTVRPAVYSTSQYPGQTFKLAARTHEHVLRVETQGFTEEDGTADFAGATVGIYPQGHELDPAYALDNAELRAFFYPRAREFLQGIANNGEVFSS